MGEVNSPAEQEKGARLRDEANDRQIIRQALIRLSKHTRFRCYLHEIDIDCRQGRLLIEGNLPSFYLKQVLQTILRELNGVRAIDNQAKVVTFSVLTSLPGPNQGSLTDGQDDGNN